VLVTGATGFLGTRLVHRLLNSGNRVRVLARSPAKAADLARAGAEVVVGDITEPSVVDGALEGMSTVYHLAGRLMTPGVPEDEYRRTHVDGTNVVLACSRRNPRIARFVHCSTTGVLGATGSEPADESAPLRPTNVYEATKAEAEVAVRAASMDGFPAVIVRPGLVYGPGDLHLLGFFRSITRRQFRPIGRTPVWLHPIYVDDLIDALVLCAQHPDAVAECFHISGPCPVTLAGLAAAIAEAAGTGAARGYIPFPAAKALALVGDRLPGNLKRSAPLTSGRLEFLTHSRVYSIDKARRLLGFAAATDLAAGLSSTISWYRESGYLPERRAS
jgi:nucleoside-diphosphate-sugar epimerase